MIEMQPILKPWYDYLAEGKIMGFKCRQCGSIEFPPVPICGKCSSTDLNWVEISGKGTLITISTSVFGIPPYNNKAVICGTVELAEGMSIPTFLPDVAVGKFEAIRAKLPCEVTLKIHQLSDQVFWPVVKLEDGLTETIAKEKEGEREEKLETSADPKEFLDLMGSVFERDPKSIEMDMNLVTDINVSSLTTFILISELNDQFEGADVDLDAIKKCKTVADLFDLYCSL